MFMCRSEGWYNVFKEKNIKLIALTPPYEDGIVLDKGGCLALVRQVRADKLIIVT